MNGIETRESIISLFSCTDYGGCGNKASSIEIGKNDQVKPMIIDPMGGRDRWIDGLDKRKPINQEDAVLRSRGYTPPK